MLARYRGLPDERRTERCGTAGNGLGFSLTPFWEQKAVYGITVTDNGVNGIAQQVLPVFCCPSCRAARQHPSQGNRFLMDFCAVTPGKITSNGQGGYTHNWDDQNGDNYLGGVAGVTSSVPLPNMVYEGIIVRTPWWVNANGVFANTGGTPPTTFATITDGSSNTLMFGEKSLQPMNYELGDWCDDRG